MTWCSIVAPLKTPMAIVQRLDADIARALDHRETADRLIQLGHEPHPSTPSFMRQYVESVLEKWGRVLKSAGAKPAG